MPSRPGKIGPAHVEHLGPLRLPPADPQNMLRQIRRVVFGRSADRHAADSHGVTLKLIGHSSGSRPAGADGIAPGMPPRTCPGRRPG
jgi:hypothetical protein